MTSSLAKPWMPCAAVLANLASPCVTWSPSTRALHTAFACEVPRALLSLTLTSLHELASPTFTSYLTPCQGPI